MNALVCLLLLAPSQLDRVQAEKDFRAANERALEGNLPGAIGLYETLIERGIEDPDVYYNLGNARAQAGDRIDAVVAYERALRLAPGDREVLRNLRLVRKELFDRELDRAPSLTLADAVEPLIAPFDPVRFGLIGGAANVLFFALLWLRRRHRRRWLTGAAVTSALAALLGLAIVAGHYVVTAEARGVLVEEVPLRQGPHEKFKTTGPALVGGRVRLLDREAGFLEVLQEDGTTGWVPAEAVTRV